MKPGCFPLSGHVLTGSGLAREGEWKGGPCYAKYPAAPSSLWRGVGMACATVTLGESLPMLENFSSHPGEKGRNRTLTSLHRLAE